MNLAIDKSKCCACTACKNICPKQAIEMILDEKGFLYPQIDKNKCIKCGLCEKVCFYNAGYNILDDHLNKIEAYAIKHKDLKIRMASQSGGAFTVFSDEILKRNGIIYGVGFSKNLKVCYKRAETKKERDEFRGSKYVQSELNDTFRLIKKDLENDKWVLFSGTPCHVAGLVKYLRKKYDKLLLIDIICHGTPSPKIFEDYLRFLEEKYNGRVEKFNFRDKNFGWKSCIETFEINKKGYNNIIYTNLFASSLVLRESCYSCQFTNLNRVSDITIGDCWGIEKNKPDINDNKGISLIILNTQKGKLLYDNINSEIDIYKINIENYMQPRLSLPNKKNPKYEEFWTDYSKKGFKYVVKKYTSLTLFGKIKKMLKKIKLIHLILEKIKKTR